MHYDDVEGKEEDSEDDVIFIRNTGGNTLADCPVVTWKTLFVFHRVTKIPLPLQRTILEWCLLSAIMFGLYHLSKFYDLISPLFLSLWLLVVLSYYGIIAIFDCVDSKSRVTPTTSSDVDGVETVEDDD